MHGSFISSTKQGSNTCVLLRIFSGVTILKTPFSSSLAICFCLDARYWDSQESASLSIHLSTGKQVSDGDAIWTCSKCFSCYLRLGLFAAKDVDAESACTGSTCAENASSAVGACIKDAGPEGTSTEGTGMESACTGGAGAVEHSGIHSQSFQISEMKLFGTGLETEARVG